MGKRRPWRPAVKGAACPNSVMPLAPGGRMPDDRVPGEAARKMKEREPERREAATRGPSESACRSRLQTAVSCAGQEPGWCASREKARHGSRQVRAGKTSAIEPLMKCRKHEVTSKPGRDCWPGMSRGATCLLPRRRPALRRREAGPGLRVEPGNLSPRCQGSGPSGGPART
jgi:hypothetical protein